MTGLGSWPGGVANAMDLPVVSAANQQQTRHEAKPWPSEAICFVHQKRSKTSNVWKWFPLHADVWL